MKKMLSFVLSMLLIVTMFPTMAFAKEEAKTWKFGELSLKAGDVLGKDTEIKTEKSEYFQKKQIWMKRKMTKKE
jgi:hypothetical protein